jgi:hypothetical protein
MNAAMRVNVPDDYLPLIIQSLEHYYAYTRAVQRDDSRYQKAADWFQQEAKMKSPTTARKTISRKVADRR